MSGLWFAASARIFFRFARSSTDQARGFQNATTVKQKWLMTKGALGYGVGDRLNAPTVFLAWGHRFLDHPETLCATLSSRDAVQQQLRVKTHPELLGSEQHGDTSGQWVEQFETMPFEGNEA